MSAPFQPGELVDIAIKGVRVDAVHANGTPDIIAEDSEGLATVWALPPQAKVERVAPAEWPPRAGDLWRRNDTDDLYFAADVHDDAETIELEIVMICAYDDHRLEPDAFRSRCAGDMTLVYREEQQDGGAS